MALRLRRDVQKASYYVWFLGAEEAKGLRGARVINSVLPYLVDRSRGQEPLKVTLQVSHKGIKIVQVSWLYFLLINVVIQWTLCWFYLNAIYPDWESPLCGSSINSCSRSSAGCLEASDSTQCHNQLGADWRHRRLRPAALQSGHQVPAPRPCLPLRLGDDGGGTASPAADPHQPARQSEAFRGAGDQVGHKFNYLFSKKKGSLVLGKEKQGAWRQASLNE